MSDVFTVFGKLYYTNQPLLITRDYVILLAKNAPETQVLRRVFSYDRRSMSKRGGFGRVGKYLFQN